MMTEPINATRKLTYGHNQRWRSFFSFGHSVRVAGGPDNLNNCCTKLIHGMHPIRQTRPQDRVSLMQHGSMRPIQCSQYDMECQGLGRSFRHLQSFRPSFPMIYCRAERSKQTVPPFRIDVHGKYLVDSPRGI